MQLEQQLTEQTWTGCYSDRWPADLLAESVAHQAKFARGLIRRIYLHCLINGLLKPGDTVLDPFAGVGLGACDALYHGLNWVGVEVEPLYVAMGRGCHCTGINKEDWARFYGRWKRVAYRDGNCWCPRCLAQAEQVLEATPQLTLLEPVAAAAYIRNSGQIPTTGPHLYEGNLQRFARLARNGAQAWLIHGDSRQLSQVKTLGSGYPDGWQGLAGVISSPPYGANEKHDYTQESRDLRRGHNQGRGSFRNCYGDAPGQLTRLPMGLVSSPPYEGSLNQHATANDTGRRLARMRRAGIDVSIRSNPGGTNGVMRRAQTYGEAPEQIGATTGDTFWSAARQVVEQCYALLAPRSPAVWVVKDYVKDGQRVEFARMWRELGLACSFEHLYDIHASFIEDRGDQVTITGEVETRQVDRKSFFRRLVEQHGAPPIDEEVVIFTRKPVF